MNMFMLYFFCLIVLFSFIIVYLDQINTYILHSLEDYAVLHPLLALEVHS